MTQFNHIGSTEERQLAATKADAVLNALQDKTPAEIDAWIDANVNSVADVKELFKRIMKLLAVLARRM